MHHTLSVPIFHFLSPFTGFHITNHAPKRGCAAVRPAFRSVDAFEGDQSSHLHWNLCSTVAPQQLHLRLQGLMPVRPVAETPGHLQHSTASSWDTCTAPLRGLPYAVRTTVIVVWASVHHLDFSSTSEADSGTKTHRTLFLLHWV